MPFATTEISCRATVGSLSRAIEWPEACGLEVVAASRSDSSCYTKGGRGPEGRGSSAGVTGHCRCGVLAHELHDAERLMRDAASEIRAALADAGVASLAAVELGDVSGWCRAQATDLRRRAARVDVRGVR